jgi:hypothetical protein
MSIVAPPAVKFSDWQYGAHLGLDEISYDIFIKDVGGGDFSASWVCQKCCEQSTWRAKASTWEAAIERAKVGAQVHHSFMHLRDRGRATLEFKHQGS